MDTHQKLWCLAKAFEFQGHWRAMIPYQHMPLPMQKVTKVSGLESSLQKGKLLGRHSTLQTMTCPCEEQPCAVIDLHEVLTNQENG